ncbi:endolysin [Mycobacterium phage Scorpia]|uniref:Lysin A n=1 Tax=Mycobacterium phage Scorpia TaxID=2517968 RepID=A0A482J4S3_9CAUD|nr:endolysin [Mycobacterium phage Scorpia]QBP29007.1 lysin A [Mycobacterium phage Scorpia]
MYQNREEHMSFRTVYGYDWSENGWRMCNRDECDIVKLPELYLVDTAPLRKGAPLTILGAWIYWYDRNVEEIFTPVWGWSATNDVANSNHLSGTAVDICAPKYPWKRYTMTADKIAKVRQGLDLFEGTVFWGRKWGETGVGSPDEMHYQMAFREGDARNEAFAKKLKDGYLGIYKAPPPVVTPPAPALDPIARHQKFLKEATERELLVYIAEQLGPGHPDWASKGKTVRDKVFGL